MRNRRHLCHFLGEKKEKTSPYCSKYYTDLSILTIKVFIQGEAGNKGVLGINTDTESKHHERILKLQENNYCWWELLFRVQLAKGAQENSDLCLQEQTKQCVVSAGI